MMEGKYEPISSPEGRRKIMKKFIALLTVTGLMVCALPVGLYAAPNADGQSEAAADVQTQAEEEEAQPQEASPSPEDNIVTTKHRAVINGKCIPYTVQAGTMVLESGGAKCEMGFMAYTRDDAEDPGSRPITFAFNGGPGSSSYFIQFGCLGPRKAELDKTGYPLSLPAKIIDNKNSVLDMTDLVFIDPVGTGYSRALDGYEESDFLGYENDIRSVGDFIRQYLNRNKRWGSPKYIAGESYGTTRAVGLCSYLADKYAMYVNGLMLISSVNDFSAIMDSGANELPYELYIPTFAAVARYHGKLSEKYCSMELEDFLDEVRSFVEKEYVPALFVGRRLPEDEKEKIAEKLSEYIGLSKEYVLKSNLRVTHDKFSRELLSDEKLIVGRYDGRITGPVTSGSLDDGSADPSSSSTDIAFANSYMKYITEELGFETDTPFLPLSMDVNYQWSFSDDNGLISQEDIIRDCMSHNPFLKIWVLCGYYDGATPFYSAEWSYNHVFLDDESAKNLQFTYYPSGHMFYIDEEAFAKFRKDAEEWYLPDAGE